MVSTKAKTDEGNKENKMFPCGNPIVCNTGSTKILYLELHGTSPAMFQVKRD